ncbi:MAG: glutathione S-transferase family protein, partial [Alphaproteobacteria bacterium]
TDQYRIFGAEPSPYSVKVRSWFRYKAVPHEWVVRTLERQKEFESLARLPLIPLVVTPEGTAMQDSTPVIEELERRHPEPPLQPRDAGLAFLSFLIEEYADEWVNKPMFHYRWTYEADREHASNWIASEVAPGADAKEQEKTAKTIRKRMIPRLAFVGSSAETAEQIEASYRRQLEILEAHLVHRPFLFGGRPSLADLGYGGQLYQLSRDPTPGLLMQELAPNVLAYVERMLHPSAYGGFEGWETLAPTLTPLLRDEIAGVFLPWSQANADALERGEERFTVDIGGRPFTQNTQKYHAKSLGVLRKRFATLDAPEWLARVLDETGCADYLKAA